MADNEKPKHNGPKKKPPGDVIFRRFRTTKDGVVLDAYKFGLKAWPIRISPEKPDNK